MVLGSMCVSYVTSRLSLKVAFHRNQAPFLRLSALTRGFPHLMAAFRTTSAAFRMVARLSVVSDCSLIEVCEQHLDLLGALAAFRTVFDAEHPDLHVRFQSRVLAITGILYCVSCSPHICCDADPN